MSSETVFRNLGASNHSKEIREENDYYATEPKAVKLLLDEETFDTNIWECACGELHISNVLNEYGYNVRNSDLIKRVENIEQLDFLQSTKKYPPKYVYVFSGRINCPKNGDFKTYKSSALSYAWFVWEKDIKVKQQ